MTAPITIALAIPTTASWAPGRKESLARLCESLCIPDDRQENDGGYTWRFKGGGAERVFVHDNKSPRHEWCARIHGWALETGASHALFLQDDMRTAPADLFWPALRAMIEARPDQIINLQAVHQDAPELAAEGVHGYTTTEGMPGPAYVLPMGILREYRGWLATALQPGAELAVPEDTLLGIFAMVTGRRIWSPVPTIVDHPGEVASTYGNDKAIRQRPEVRWDNLRATVKIVDGMVRMLDEGALAKPEFWATEPRHLGRFYDITSSIARRYVKGYAAAEYDRDTKEPCRPMPTPPCCFCGRKVPSGVVSKQNGALLCGTCLRNAAPMVGARFAKPATPLIIVATPLKGNPHPAHAAAIGAIKSAEQLNVQAPFELGPWNMPSDDLVRVRSRLVRDIVELKRRGKPVTHLWFVDADIAPRPGVLMGMLLARRPFVTAPYPMRAIDWAAVERVDHRGAEARGAQYWHIERFAGLQAIDRQGCTEIRSNGLGCALIEVTLLERMVEHYGKDFDPSDEIARLVNALREVPDAITPEAALAGLTLALRRAYDLGRQHGRPLVFDDVPMPGMPPRETVALFDLILRDRQLLSEDKSFCRRVREMGEKVWLYLGPGAPVDHYGETCFRGLPESLDIRPIEEEKEKIA